MKQIFQSLKSGRVTVEEVPAPADEPVCLLVHNRTSAISVGTERSTIQRIQQGVIGLSLDRQGLVQELFRHLSSEGLGPTLQKIQTRLEEPMPLGYSSAGVVAQVGESVEGFQVGDPVACAGYGYACHAQMVCVPKTLCVRIPRGVSWEEAAFATLGAISLQAFRTAEAKIGEAVAVLGLGIIGQLIVQVARAAGCRVFGFDPRPERVAIAQELGMEAGSASMDFEAVTQAVRRFTRGHGFDAVLIAAASEDPQPLSWATELARECGVIVVVGEVPLSVSRERFYEKELQLRLARSYGPGRYDPAYERRGLDYPLSYVRWTAQRNMAAFLELVASGKVRITPLITHRFQVEQAPQAYELLTSRQAQLLGAIFQYEPATEAPSPVVHQQTQKRIPPVGTLGIGIIGAGHFANGVLLPILSRLPGVRLVSVATAHGATARAAARRFGIASFTTDYRSLLEDPAVQAVLIVTPHHLHASLMLEALERGRHCFVEKPLCLTEAELRKVASCYLSLKTPPVLSVGFNRRFSPLALRAKEWLGERPGPLTILYRVNAGTPPSEGWWRDPLVSGGRLLGELGHFIDLMSFLAGAEPTSVSSFAPHTASGFLEEESLAANLSFADGSVGTLAYLTSGDRACPKERIELFADRKVVILDDFRSVAVYHQGRQKRIRRLFQEKGFRQELAAFVEAAHSGGPSPIPWSELVATTLSTFKALESLRRGNPQAIDPSPYARP